MIYAIEYGQRNPVTDPVTFYGPGGKAVKRADAIKFFDKVEAESMVVQFRGMLPTDPLYADCQVVLLDATMTADTRVEAVLRHKEYEVRPGLCQNSWSLLYENGRRCVATWLNPPAGALSIQVGHRFADHCFAVPNEG